MNNAFLNDYNEICHPDIYDFVGQYISKRTVGYEEDQYCAVAKEQICKEFSAVDAKVQFFIGGTSANLTMISYMLNHSYEAIIATKDAHILNHEGGAIEGCGHKILIGEDYNGKLKASSIEEIYLAHQRDNHMVLPKLVYISNSTEIGTVYTLQELKDISKMCKKYNLYLFVDGARVFFAQYSSHNDIELADYAKYADAFYIGGTKNGLMLGEAAVIVNKELQQDYMRHMKNKGAMLAKGSLIGLNFMALMDQKRYKKFAVNGNEMARKLASFLESKGYEFTYPPESNQLFVNMLDTEVERLSKIYGIGDLGYVDKECRMKSIRLVTSFNTTENDIDEFIETFDQWSDLK